MTRLIIIIVASMFLLFAIAALMISAAKGHAEEQRQIDLTGISRDIEILMRKCETMWPEKGDHYEDCVTHAKTMFRRDI